VEANSVFINRINYFSIALVHESGLRGSLDLSSIERRSPPDNKRRLGPIRS